MRDTTSTAGQITTREELIYALSRGAELEHGLICIYLFAAFSMKRFLHEGIDELQQNQIRNWESVVLEVAKQEMEHLGIVGNLLNAIGAPQHFARPNLPQNPSYYGTEGAFTLEPFGLATIKRFMEFEKPATSSFATGRVAGDELVPTDVAVTDFHTVQELYAAILQGFVNLDADPDVDLFIGSPAAQLDDSEIVVGFGNLEYGITMVEVTDLKSATRAIEEIVEQGEGIVIDEPPATAPARELQKLYRKIARDVRAMESLDFRRSDWRPSGERLVAAATSLLPVLARVGDVLEKERRRLTEAYNDPGVVEYLLRLLHEAITTLVREKERAEKILAADDPRDPARRLARIRRRMVEVAKYDAEGITLAGFIDPKSHYLQFWRIYEQLKTIDYQPARLVARNPALRLHEDNKAFADRITIATYPYSRQAMELFNACYEVTVQMLILTFSFNELSPADRTLLINTAFFPFMTMVIRPLSEALTQLPAFPLPEDGDCSGVPRTGPPFEFYSDVALLPNREAGWIYLNERLRQIAGFGEALIDPPKELERLLGSAPFEKLEKQMRYLHTNLVRIADNFRIGTRN